MPKRKKPSILFKEVYIDQVRFTVVKATKTRVTLVDGEGKQISLNRDNSLVVNLGNND